MPRNQEHLETTNTIRINNNIKNIPQNKTKEERKNINSNYTKSMHPEKPRSELTKETHINTNHTHTSKKKSTLTNNG